MVERFIQNACEARATEPVSRERGLMSLESLVISPEQRRILMLLFERAWPAGSAADFKPTSWEIAITVEMIGQIIGPNFARSTTKRHMDPLVLCGLVVHTQLPGGRAWAYRINWSKVYEIGTKKEVETPPTPPTRYPSDPSDLLGGVGGVERFESEGSEGYRSEGSEASSDDPSPIVLAIRQVGYFLANANKIAVNQAVSAGVEQIIAALGSLIQEFVPMFLASYPSDPSEAKSEESEASDPSHPSDSLFVCLTDTELNKQSNIQTINQGSEGSEGSGIGGVASEGSDGCKDWIGRPFPSITPIHLSTDAHLRTLYQAARSQGKVEPGEAAALEFFAKASYCVRSPKVQNPGGLFGSWIAGGKGWFEPEDMTKAKAIASRLRAVATPARTTPDAAKPPDRRPLPKPPPKPVAATPGTPSTPANTELARVFAAKVKDLASARIARLKPIPDPAGLGDSLDAVLRVAETISGVERPTQCQS